MGPYPRIKVRTVYRIWKRSGHLYYRQTKYNCANEIWALGSNPFSHDATSSDFQNIYLYKTT